MNHRPAPLPTASRLRETEELIARQGTDLARWSRSDSLATQWDARAAMAAEWIPAGASVLDVGCGAMALGELLAPGCTYVPADVVARRPGCLVVDLNADQFPPGRYDWVTFLGVLEYVHDPVRALARAREAAPALIVTYCTRTGSEVAARRGMGWVNDFTADAFAAVLAEGGWQIERRREVKRGPGNLQLMFACR